MVSVLALARSVLASKSECFTVSFPDKETVKQPENTQKQIKTPISSCFLSHGRQNVKQGVTPSVSSTVSPETNPETLDETVKRGAVSSFHSLRGETVKHTLPSGWADAFSAFQGGPVPIGLKHNEWQAVLDQALSLADVHAVTLDRIGWTFGDLFRLPPHWQQTGARGGGFYIAEAIATGGRIQAISATTIHYTTGSGAEFATWREGCKPWLRVC
jgi:hypothetical protein